VTSADLRGTLPGSNVLVQPASGSEVRVTRAGDNVLVEVPAGMSADDARAAVTRLLGSESQAIQTATQGAFPGNVAVTRTTDDDVSYHRNADGTYRVDVPYGMAPDAVAARLATLRQEASAALAGTTDTGALSNQQNVVVGAPFDDVAAGQAMLSALTRGDRTALAALGVAELPETFTSGGQTLTVQQIEWGLGQLPDGRVVIIRGEPGRVNWGGFPDLVSLAHSHPTGNAGTGGLRPLDVSRGGTVDQVLTAGNNAAALLPSPGDLRYVDARGIQNHVLHTPYRYDPQTGTLQAAGFEGDLPSVSITIVETYRTPDGALRARIQIQGGGQTIWSGDIMATGLGCCMPLPGGL
jgi:hypothetical protein